MRTLVEPPPTSHCIHCGGELRLKQIEVANQILDLDNEIFVCIKCGREQSCTVSHNHNVNHAPKVPGKAAQASSQSHSDVMDGALIHQTDLD
jgi:hypothetical protein